MTFPPKPSFAQPCNHCGLCCESQLCEVPVMAFPSASAPCRCLDVRQNVALCSLVTTEAAAGVEPTLANSLGIGCGCSMPDSDTTDAQVKELDRVSCTIFYGRLPTAA